MKVYGCNHTIFTLPKRSSAAGFLKDLAHKTLRHKKSLVHGDFSPKNILIYEGKLILLDHEVFHFGDPAFDVGFALTHFLSKAHHLPKEESPSGRCCGTLLAGLQRSDCCSGLGRWGRVAGGTSYSGMSAGPRGRKISTASI